MDIIFNCTLQHYLCVKIQVQIPQPSVTLRPPAVYDHTATLTPAPYPRSEQQEPLRQWHEWTALDLVSWRAMLELTKEQVRYRDPALQEDTCKRSSTSERLTALAHEVIFVKSEGPPCCYMSSADLGYTENHSS